jgi:hypothetical protein
MADGKTSKKPATTAGKDKPPAAAQNKPPAGGGKAPPGGSGGTGRETPALELELWQRRLAAPGSTEDLRVVTGPIFRDAPPPLGPAMPADLFEHLRTIKVCLPRLVVARRDEGRWLLVNRGKLRKPQAKSVCDIALTRAGHAGERGNGDVQPSPAPAKCVSLLVGGALVNQP